MKNKTVENNGNNETKGKGNFTDQERRVFMRDADRFRLFIGYHKVPGQAPKMYPTIERLTFLRLFFNKQLDIYNKVNKLNYTSRSKDDTDGKMLITRPEALGLVAEFVLSLFKEQYEQGNKTVSFQRFMKDLMSNANGFYMNNEIFNFIPNITAGSDRFIGARIRKSFNNAIDELSDSMYWCSSVENLNKPGKSQSRSGIWNSIIQYAYDYIINNITTDKFFNVLDKLKEENLLNIITIYNKRVYENNLGDEYFNIIQGITFYQKEDSNDKNNKELKKELVDSKDVDDDKDIKRTVSFKIYNKLNALGYYETEFINGIHNVTIKEADGMDARGDRFSSDLKYNIPIKKKISYQKYQRSIPRLHKNYLLFNGNMLKFDTIRKVLVHDFGLEITRNTGEKEMFQTGLQTTKEVKDWEKSEQFFDIKKDLRSNIYFSEIDDIKERDEYKDIQRSYRESNLQDEDLEERIMNDYFFIYPGEERNYFNSEIKLVSKLDGFYFAASRNCEFMDLINNDGLLKLIDHTKYYPGGKIKIYFNNGQKREFFVSNIKYNTLLIERLEELNKDIHGDNTYVINKNYDFINVSRLCGLNRYKNRAFDLYYENSGIIEGVEGEPKTTINEIYNVFQRINE